MTQGIKVHTGTVTNGQGEKRPCAWVVTTLTLEPEAHDLINGLGSKYFRHETMNDDHTPDVRPEGLPESLTQRQILAAYREGCSYYGEQNLWSWGDSVEADRFGYAWQWLAELVVGAFPEMKEYVK